MKESVVVITFLLFLLLVAVTLKKYFLFKGVQGRGEAKQMTNKENSFV